MSENNAIQSNGEATASLPKIHQKNSRLTVLFFVFLLAIGIAFAGINLFNDVNDAGAVYTDYIPFLLLGLALLIALGFEFVNGFHDTANAVATVIYTHSLSPMVAVIWSGFFNFLGVLLSSGAVAFGIIALLCSVGAWAAPKIRPEVEGARSASSNSPPVMALAPQKTRGFILVVSMGP